MKRLYIAALALCAMQAQAQDTYTSAKMLETDLNGTARYVSMGGALEALGADISTMSTNPAGTAMFHSSQIAVTGGVNFQTNENNSCSFAGETIDFNGKKNRVSFDQIGFVVNFGKDESFFNLGFSYRKSQNFDQILTAANSLTNASQSKLTSMKYKYMQSLSDYNKDMITNGVDANYESLMTKVQNEGTTYLDYLTATDYRFGQYQKGYIGEYDFNFSYNGHERWYLGLTIGLHDVHYTGNSLYDESNELSCYTDAYEEMHITGVGVDFKLGAIFRPAQEGNFRIGAYIHSPVFYRLRYEARSDIEITSPEASGSQGNDCYYNYNLNTPWRFGVSLGDVFGNCVALGATYEYQKLNSLDIRIDNDGTWGRGSYSDSEMNSWTRNCIKGMHTIKVGAEIRPVSLFAIRLGYNYLSPQFSKSAYRNGVLISPGSAYACSTDYTNWYETHRFTAGLGFRLDKHFQLDLAYQYQTRKGEFSPFMSYEDDTNPSDNNIPNGCNVNFQRHQALATLTYKF